MVLRTKEDAMLKRWAILSTCAIAALVIFMAYSELGEEQEEKEEL